MTTTNTPERATAIPPLLPCPFCGAPCQHQGNYGDTRDGLHRFVACTKCAANIYRYRQTQNEADAALYEAWNARVNTHDALQAENERLREQVKELNTVAELTAIETVKTVIRLREQVKELREGLEPFAALEDSFSESYKNETQLGVEVCGKGHSTYSFTLGDLRHARDLRENIPGEKHRPDSAVSASHTNSKLLEAAKEVLRVSIGHKPSQMDPVNPMYLVSARKIEALRTALLTPQEPNNG